MSAGQIEAIIQFAISLGMILLGLGFVRLPPNPRAGFLDPSSLIFKRLMLVGGLCLLAVAVIALLELE